MSPTARSRSPKLVLASLLACLTLVGCGGGGDGTVASAGGGAAPPPATTAPGSTGNANEPRVGSAALSWTAPVENEDGSYLANLAGYRVYSGTDPNSLVLKTTVADPRTTSIEIGNLVAGATHYFAVSAYTSAGQESSRSSVGSKLVN